MEHKVEWSDVQALIGAPFARLKEAAYVLLKFTGDPVSSRAWLQRLLATMSITTVVKGMTPAAGGADRPAKLATLVNIAFSIGGIQRLGLDDSSLASFPYEFQLGMHSRARGVLGDCGASAPEHWDWGGREDTTPDVIVVVFAANDVDLGAETAKLKQTYGADVRECAGSPVFACAKSYEHFGHRDGISNPEIRGLPTPRSAAAQRPENCLAPGEFILGYGNYGGRLPPTPSVPWDGSCVDRLHPTEATETDGTRSVRADLGRNGSYLVVRQLEQKVGAYRKFLADTAQAWSGNRAPDSIANVSAKLVGRWPSGAPLTLSPDQDDAALALRNDFGYAVTDSAGDRCPIGAHIRRSFPRDSLGDDPAKALALANGHRILRRGRLYGEALAADAIDDGRTKRGIMFLCFNAQINRQFEFIQQNWINSTKFGVLTSEVDPLVGQRCPVRGSFSMQALPVRKATEDMDDFVVARGGAYFFCPGVTALNFLANPGAVAKCAAERANSG